jgi:poly(U)-specific endoribonuclease
MSVIFQDVSDEEGVTRDEIREEQNFIDACVDTEVMRIAHAWMVEKKLMSEDEMTFKKFLHRMWFALYPR